MLGQVYRGKILAEVLENIEISNGIFRMSVSASSITKTASAGQFVNLYCKDGSRLLPRPISICEIDKKSGILMFVYAVVGKGTEEFSIMKSGDYVGLLGPLGNGFNIDDKITKHIIVGGGVGIPPLLELVKSLKGDKEVYLGFRTGRYLIEEFEKYDAKVYITTDDGSYGKKGTVIEMLEEQDVSGHMIYSCGPKAMIKAVAKFAKDKGIPAQISLEERMGCGIGTCVGCVVKIIKDNGWEYKKVCKDGPVFLGEEVLWDD